MFTETVRRAAASNADRIEMIWLARKVPIESRISSRNSSEKAQSAKKEKPLETRSACAFARAFPGIDTFRATPVNLIIRLNPVTIEVFPITVTKRWRV